MPNINLSWTPGVDNGNPIAQRVKAIAKANGTAPNMTTGFTPVNNMSKTVSTAVFNTDYANTVYRFMVETICSSGGPTPNTNGIREQLVFRCLSVPPKTADIVDSVSYTVKLLRNGYTQIDGQNFPNPMLSLDSVEFSLYDGTNTTPVAGPFTGILTGTGASETYEHTFTGLSPNASYTPRSVLFATINGVSVRSDSAQYLNAPCLHPVVTTTGTPNNPGDCVKYTFTNTGASVTFVSYDNCAGATTSLTLNPGQTETICVLRGSPIYGTNISITEIGPCVPCYQFRNDSPTTTVTVNYIDCTGVASTATLAPNQSVCGQSADATLTNTLVACTG